MKKAFALLLALCLLCGSVALAEGNSTSITQDEGNVDNSYSPAADTTVQLKVNDTYEVTIPTTLNFTNTNVGYTTKATVSLTKCIIPERGWLKVTITKTGSTPNLGDEYKVRLNGTSDTYAIGYAINVSIDQRRRSGSGIEVLSYDNTDTSKPKLPCSKDVIFKLTDTIFPVSGTYSDNVTFTVTTGVTKPPEELPADPS